MSTTQAHRAIRVTAPIFARSPPRSTRLAATCIAKVIGLLVLLASPPVAAEQDGHCSGSSAVKVVHEDPSELDAACRAFSEVLGYFRSIGFDVPSKALLRFADRAGDDYAGHATAHGYFDPQRSQIVMYRLSDVKPWRQSWSPKLLDSFTRHEIVHLAIWQVLEGDLKRLRREWHEFIAYAIQLDLMAPDLRQEILAVHADIAPASDLAQINEFSYGMNPQGFAVLAYKTYLDRGAAVFVRQLLSAEIKPPPFSYPFAVLPHEVQR